MIPDMVSILKEPAGDSKGILVFTHKEREFFLEPIPSLKAHIDPVKEKYLFGMHWGHYADNIGRTPFVDFHLAGSGTVQFTNEVDVPILNYCSRNFVPEYFSPTDAEESWDIITIAPPTRLKRLSELLEWIRKTRSQGSDLTALFVCPRPEPLPSPKWDAEFIDTVQNDLASDEKEDIRIITPLRTSDDIYPIPHKIMPHFYNIGKSFALFSKKEGESRVISESLMTGTPVIAREGLKGGGLGYLDEKNSLLFSSESEAIDIFHSIHDSSGEYSFDPSYLKNELYAPKSRSRFKSALEQVYEFHDVPYHGELVDKQFAFLLPSHSLTLPQDLRKSGTNDLKDQVSMIRFCDSLSGSSLKERKFEVLLYRYKNSFENLPSSLAGDMKNVLWQVEQRTPLNIYSTLKSIR